MPHAALPAHHATAVCVACAGGAAWRREAAPARVRVRSAERWGAVMATGLIGMGRRDLPVMHPSHVPDMDTAKRMLKYADKAGLMPYARAFAYYSYRRAGQCGSSSVVAIDAREHPDARAALETALGPLVQFEALPPRFAARLSLSPAGAPLPPQGPPRPVPAPALPSRLPMRTPAQVPVPPRDLPRSIPRVVDLPRMRAPAPDPDTAAGKLDQLARMVSYLSPSHRDPEQFHVQKSSIAAELRSIARLVGAGA